MVEHAKGDWLWGVGGAIAGLGLMAIAGRVVYWGYAQDDWIATEAQVIQASQTRRTASGSRTRMQYRFRYRYTVDGRSLVGNRFSYEYVAPSEIQGVQQFDVGDTLTIYYDPDWPQRAVVKQARPTVWVYVFGSLGIPWVIAGGAIVVRHFKAEPRDRADRPQH